ncbi:MAG: hypothetical protein ABUS79_08990 [Pseudomonadota bacterium]
MKNIGLLLISVLAFGCATQKYGFRPTGPVTSAEAGYPASRYGVPPESPRGEVFITSFGTRAIDTGPSKELIHVRVAVANQSDNHAWSVDPGQQMIATPGAPPQRPDFMEIDGRQNGTTTVPPGQRRVFDLYYRLPPGARDVGAIPTFELQWQVNTGDKSVGDRTAFSREPIDDYDEGPRTRVAVGVGVGVPWWAYGYGPGWYGPWGPYWGVGWGYRYRPYYGGTYGGGYYGRHGGYGGPRLGGGGGGGFGRGGGGGGSIRAPTMRGRPGR